MGGFHLFQCGSRDTSHDAINTFVLHEDDVPLHPLSSHDLFNNTADFSSFTVPTEVEIQDEIVTLAYAAMNFVIYIFWRNKPLNVNRPVRVFQKSDPNVADGNQSHGSESALIDGKSMLEKIIIFIVGGQDEDVNLSREVRVPRFWANSNSEKDVTVADVIVLGVGICFGAIHCIAWSFSFPAHVELLIWRISCVAITSVPVYIPLMFVLAKWLENMDFDRSGTVFFGGPLSGGILYIIARAATLVLAFSSLRDLPPGAYETVYWTTFIPHV